MGGRDGSQKGGGVCTDFVLDITLRLCRATLVHINQHTPTLWFAGIIIYLWLMDARWLTVCVSWAGQTESAAFTSKLWSLELPAVLRASWLLWWYKSVRIG